MKAYCGNCSRKKKIATYRFKPYMVCYYYKDYTADCQHMNRNRDCHYYKPTLKHRIKSVIDWINGRLRRFM